MKIFLVLSFTIISFSLSAQVGRYEEPVDTIPIGGQVQEDKETQMKAQDQLTADLLAVRDSLKFISPDRDAVSRKAEIDEVINGLRNHDQSPELMKKGYAVLNEIRAGLRAGKETTNLKSPRK